MSVFRASPEALEQARALGVTGKVEVELYNMYRQSAPFSHERGNRRFGDLMFVVKDAVMLSIERVDVDPVKEAHRARQRQQRARRKRDSDVLDLTE
jgi:hypothetical protein